MHPIRTSTLTSSTQSQCLSINTPRAVCPRQACQAAQQPCSCAWALDPARETCRVIEPRNGCMHMQHTPQLFTGVLVLRLHGLAHMLAAEHSQKSKSASFGVPKHHADLKKPASKAASITQPKLCTGVQTQTQLFCAGCRLMLLVAV